MAAITALQPASTSSTHSCTTAKLRPHDLKPGLCITVNWKIQYLLQVSSTAACVLAELAHSEWGLLKEHYARDGWSHVDLQHPRLSFLPAAPSDFSPNLQKCRVQGRDWASHTVDVSHACHSASFFIESSAGPTRITTSDGRSMQVHQTRYRFNMNLGPSWHAAMTARPHLVQQVRAIRAPAPEGSMPVPCPHQQQHHTRKKPAFYAHQAQLVTQCGTTEAS